MINLRKLFALCVIFVPVALLAGTAMTSFQVSIHVNNPCKIGTHNGHKFLYDCPSRSKN
jgi:hypothetical protein